MGICCFRFQILIYIERKSVYCVDLVHKITKNAALSKSNP